MSINNINYNEDEANINSHNQIYNNIILKLPIVFNNIITKNNIFQVSKPSIFDSQVSISFQEYFERILNYTNAEIGTIIHCFYLIDSLSNQSKIVLTDNNICKLFFILLYISIKFNEDIIYKDNDYSIISGLSVQEIIFLEIYTLKLLDYRLIPNQEKFCLYFKAFQ